MDKIIQIISLDNITITYESEGERFNSKIIGLALWQSGDLTLLELDKNGTIEVVGQNIVDVIIN